MRIPFSAHPLAAWGLAGLVGLVGCSQSQKGSPAPAESIGMPSSIGDCTVQLTGNKADSLTFPSCGELRVATSNPGPSNVVLGFHFASVSLQTLDISIALGASPWVGTYASASSAEWSAQGVGASSCTYSAGSDSVPRGSFKLTLTSVDVTDAGPAPAPGGDADADAGAGSDAASADAGTLRSAGIVAHGVLELAMTVHAPAATSCGAGDLENVVVNF